MYVLLHSYAHVIFPIVKMIRNDLTLSKAEDEYPKVFIYT